MVTVLDGGMGGELIARGVAKRGGLWSAQPLLDNPEAVYDLHLEYIGAGAGVITTNTYSTVPSYLAKEGLAEKFDELAALAAGLARRAATRGGAEVAGALPPLGESYRPDLVPADSESRPIYRALALAIEPDVDLFLCETMSSAREARNAAIEAVEVAQRGRQQPVFVSFTLGDEPGSGLRSGESIQDALTLLADLPIAGYLINCCRPRAIERGLAELSALSEGPIGGYANRMESVPAGWTLDNEVRIQYRDDLSPAIFAEWGKRCVASGASIVGGCCGIGPRDIEVLVNHLKLQVEP